MTHNDPRDTAAFIGRITGQDDIAQTALSGRLPAAEAVPLLAGMVDGVVQSLFAPIVSVQTWEPFRADVPMGRPLIAVGTMLDGSKFRVTIEAVR